MNEFTFEISLSPDFFERHKYSMSQSKIALIIPESIKKFFLDLILTCGTKINQEILALACD